MPPERFVGRESEIATAFDQIYSRSNLAIWGGPGVGKSSFLEYLASPQVWYEQGLDPSQAVIVCLNCLSIFPFRPSAFWREVLSLMKEELEGDAGSKIDELLGQAEVTKDNLRQVVRQIGRQNKFLVLLLDDYDAVVRPHDEYTEADIEEFLSECRSLAYHSQEGKYISVIVASLRRLNDLGPRLTPNKSPWYNHYLFQPLKPFTNEEIEVLLGGIPMTPTLKEAIRDIAGGNPALLQNAGLILYSQQQIPDPETFTREFVARTEQFFQQTWELCNEVEQTVLMLVALSGLKSRLQNLRYDIGDIDIIFSQRDREITDLEKWGVIRSTTEDSSKTTFCFASSIMEWWVINKIENSNEKKLQQWQKVFVNMMTHKQAEQVTTVISNLWEHRDKLGYIVKWMSPGNF